MSFIKLLIFTLLLPSIFSFEKANAEPLSSTKGNMRKFDEDSGESFSAKVKIVREVQEETEVFFESDKVKGVYILPNNAKNFSIMKNKLHESLKAGGPSVKINTDAEKRIQSVEIEQNRAPASQKIDWDKI